MELILLDSKEYKTAQVFNQLSDLYRSFYLKFITTLISLLSFYYSNNPVKAAQTDKIISVITSLTQDFYSDFVYLSLGFCTTVCIFHLVMIVFVSGDERARNKHVKAIITAIGAWCIINLFSFFIAKIFNLTGANTPSDIFNTGGYGG